MKNRKLKPHQTTPHLAQALPPEALCGRCQRQPARGPHLCALADALGVEGPRAQCNCCKSCTAQCSEEA